MNKFFTKHLNHIHSIYLTLGIITTTIITQWYTATLNEKFFIICIILTFISSIIVTIVVFYFVSNLIVKIFVTIISCLIITIALLVIYEFSPFPLAILGIAFLSGTMQLFYSIKDLLPKIENSQIQSWLQLTLTLFTIFISSIMVGFVISHSSLFGDVLKGNIDKRLPNVGMSANILITFYFWVGAALIFFSGIRHLWGSNVNKKKKK